jgi:aspartate kinase
MDLKSQGFLPIIVVSALNGLTDTLLDVANFGFVEKDSKKTDSLLSEGEQLSAKILQLTLESIDLKAKAILISDGNFPIITDEKHQNANVLLKETNECIMETIFPLLEEGIIPIVPGFIGKSKNGATTTLGRGSSDVTAVLVAKALNAENVILLKDVPGILSANPDIVDSPKILSKITVEECLNLGLRGGEVLCPISLKYKPENINVRVVSYNESDLFKGGTEVVGKLEGTIKVKVERKKKAAVAVIGKKMNEVRGLLADFSGTLRDNEINVYSVSASDNSICFYIDMKQQKKAQEVLHDLVLNDDRLSAVSSLPDISMIIIAGRIFEAKSKVLGKIIDALTNGQVEIIDINTSASEADIFVRWKDRFYAKKILEGLF